MSNFDENVIAKLKRLEREVERLKVGEKADNTGWIPVSSTWTYASATTITVPSGAAAIYKVGQGFRLTANGVVKQGYIVGVADTLLTTAGDALTSHTFSAISYTNTPQTAIGFPVWFSWTPSEIGWTGVPTGTYAFTLSGAICTAMVYMTGGTSDAVNAEISPPIPCSLGMWGACGWAMNAGAVLTTPAQWQILAAGNIKFFTNSASAAWTASGIKRVIATVTYGI